MTEHSIKLNNRNRMELTGIKNVQNFDDMEIILESIQGYLVILGNQLHITMLNLDEGKVVLEGEISSLEYKAQGVDIKAKGKNIISRLLK